MKLSFKTVVTTLTSHHYPVESYLHLNIFVENMLYIFFGKLFWREYSMVEHLKKSLGMSFYCKIFWFVDHVFIKNLVVLFQRL